MIPLPKQFPKSLSEISIPSFSKLLSKWRKHDSIGIDWGTKDLKWVQLKALGKNQYELHYLDITPLPENEADIISTLKEYVTEHNFKQMPTAVSFQDDSFACRRMEIPKMPIDDLIEAIRWQMRDIAEGSIDDYTVRYSLIEEKALPDINRLTVLGLAMKKQNVLRRVQLLEKSGLSPFFIEPTPISMAFSTARVLKLKGETGWNACLDIGLHRSYFLVLCDDTLHFLRAIPGLTADQSSKEDYATKLSVEIQQSLDLFSISYPAEKIKKLFLAGGGTSIPSLPELLQKNVGLQTEIFNPFLEIINIEKFPKGQEQPYLFGPALGVACATQ